MLKSGTLHKNIPKIYFNESSRTLKMFFKNIRCSKKQMMQTLLVHLKGSTFLEKICFKNEF